MTHASGGAGASAREVIMARIREALRVPAPLPHSLSHALAPPDNGGREKTAAPAAHSTGLPTLTVLPESAARPWLPDCGETPADRLRILLANLAALRAVVHRANDLKAAEEYVFTLARERDWRRVAWHAHPLVEPLLAGVPCATQQITATNFDKHGLESCDAGITACDALVAQTGSILVSSATCGGRVLSILPPVHVGVATLDQIVATLADALHAAKTRHAGRMPSMLSFITGPSRTGDIERILVLGAHGPKELLLFLVG